MVTQFPLDSMHLVDLDAVKKLLKLLIKKEDIKKINEKLTLVANYIPSKFGRISRTLDEINNWTSSEFRQFLLYTGVFILKDSINMDLYYHFLLLHCGIRLLSRQKSSKVEANIAQQILEDFVVYFGSLYGDELVSFNIHGLLHLSACVWTFGLILSIQQLFLRLDERTRLSANTENISKLGQFDINFEKGKDSFCFCKKVGILFCFAVRFRPNKI
ncbi:uncharacterized protein LOC118746489 [Rhagoletis pomonella]|uniref:uncharacterized protein LOC118746489 n=1 Tax=Rhagoletis pomonella TaxID=28610 RepID=UPI001786F75D|nr:uncharacterized protein LOC118746489 [Rhagoletis pomonella]